MKAGPPLLPLAVALKQLDEFCVAPRDNRPSPFDRAPAPGRLRRSCGQRLKAWRLRANLTRLQLAQQVACADPRALEQRLYRLEAGRVAVSLELMVPLCAALDLPLAVMLPSQRNRARLHLLVHRLPRHKLPAAWAVLHRISIAGVPRSR